MSASPTRLALLEVTNRLSHRDQGEEQALQTVIQGAALPGPAVLRPVVFTAGHAHAEVDTMESVDSEPPRSLSKAEVLEVKRCKEEEKARLRVSSGHCRLSRRGCSTWMAHL